MREPRHYEAPLCAQTGNGDAWFPESGTGTTYETLQARSICRQCIHQSECAEWGINYEKYGIWGGLIPTERRAIRKLRGIRLRQEDIA